jgi:hypothetical protein
VTWTQEETGFSGVYLERSIDGGTTFTPLANLEGDATSYDDAAVEVDVEYCYRVRNRRCGVYSPYSNIDCGELELVSGCVYAAPEEMSDAAPFLQTFDADHFTNASWDGGFPNSMAPGGPTGAFGGMGGNLFMSEDGKTVIASSNIGPGMETAVVTRQADDSFTVQKLHDNGGTVLWGYVMSRTGLIAGRVEGGINGHSAVWLSGPASAPTIDSSVEWWTRISPDGTKLYGWKPSGNQSIERTIGGADVLIGNGGRICGLNYCCDVVVLSSQRVYKKILGTWTHVATLADATGDTESSPVCCNITGDGTKAFGSDGANEVPYMWDLTGTGTLTATPMGVPADQDGTCMVTFVAASGNAVVGWYNNDGVVLKAQNLIWLACDGFSIARNLQDYLATLGMSILEIDEVEAGVFIGLDNTVCNATATAFAWRGDWDDTDRTMAYAAAPTPSC